MWVQVATWTLVALGLTALALVVGRALAARRRARAEIERHLLDAEWNGLAHRLATTTALSRERVDEWVSTARTLGLTPGQADTTIESMELAGLGPKALLSVMAASNSWSRPIGRFGVGR